MVCQSLSRLTLSPASCTPAELAFACLAFAWITKRACRLPPFGGGSRLRPLPFNIGDSYEQQRRIRFN
jgi:hypothetical protein